MMKTTGSSLFQRIQSSATQRHSSRQLLSRTEYLHQLIESVKAHLEHLLNTRAGASQSSIEYGLQDFNDAAVGSKDQARSIARDIKRCISDYELRLSNVEVNFSGYKNDDPTVLQFGIRCSFHLDNIKDKVTIELYLDKDRQFKLL